MTPTGGTARRLIVAGLLSMTLLAGCGSEPGQPPAPFSASGQFESEDLGRCATYTVSGRATAHGDKATVTDLETKIRVTDACQDGAEAEVDRLTSHLTWDGLAKDEELRATFESGSSFSHSNSGGSFEVPVSKQESGRPCLKLELGLELQVDASSDSIGTPLEPCVSG